MWRVQILVGRQVAVFLSDFAQWFVGKVLDVYQRRTVRENFKIMFDDGDALVRLDTESYGKHNNWVLLPEQENVGEQDE